MSITQVCAQGRSGSYGARMQIRQFVYTVSAYSLSGPRTATCILAIGAMRLADEWAEQCCINIRVADPFGATFTREEFRATLPVSKRMAEWQR